MRKLEQFGFSLTGFLFTPRRIYRVALLGPYDRLLFKDGKIDPLKTATFDFLITDFAPRRTFFLVQEPRKSLHYVRWAMFADVFGTPPN